MPKRSPAPGKATFQAWAAGFGLIRHTPETRKRIRTLSRRFASPADGVPFWELMMAADRLARAALWLTVHDTYAKSVHLDGRALQRGEFKDRPEGHTGSALNIIPGYVGYLLANALSGHTRAWIAEQGHAVSGIDSVNVLVGNVTPAHERYTVDDEGLTRFVRDFYSYRIGAGGHAESPRGSHVNPNTAGGIMEGGYLGFAGLQYVHMPLKGERLVAFLSDGAFEEQRGPDWASRWWRPEDCGPVTPILINNGRRIDQRTTTTQQGGTKWLHAHLDLNGFTPVEFDGRDPAAFAWAILEMEERLEKDATRDPIRLPYGIATTVKGFGFYGAGTNAAHNLPLGGTVDDILMRRFNEHARLLWVPPEELRPSIDRFRRHKNRPREKDHPLVVRKVDLKRLPPPGFLEKGQSAPPMTGVDAYFVETCLANPHLRPRVGNPDEMRSNLLDRTLDTLKHRVTQPERGAPEAATGKVITALNEEAVACAALANKGGINLVHTYEAFGTKMYGALRQEIIFAAHALRAGRPQGWLSVPVVLTSHTYENGKNEQSHQDPGLCESLMGEPAHVSRVLFPADVNSALAVMEALFQTRGQIWTLVVPKRPLPVVFTGDEARQLVKEGALVLRRDANPLVILTAIGGYQLQHTLLAYDRLRERKVDSAVICMIEPRRFAEARDPEEAAACHPAEVRERFYPPSVRPRLFVTHTRSGRIQGLLQVVDTGPQTLALGYRNQGGTYNENGMMFINHQSWAHIVEASAKLAGIPREQLLTESELDVLDHKASPHGVIF